WVKAPCAPLNKAGHRADFRLRLYSMRIAFILLFGFVVHVAAAQKLPVVNVPTFKKDTFNITAFGGTADGITLNTRAIDEAISACHKSGGGTVVIPKGF